MNDHRLHRPALLLGLACAALGAQASTTAPEEAADTAVMPQVTITGINGNATEGTGSYTGSGTKTANRMDMSLRETPQSVSVITRARLDEMGLYRLDDALAQTTGIMVDQADSERTNFSARGFTITNQQVDGLTIGGNAPLSDTILYDRIEVVRGATGLMGGTGDPSATINMVRKRPKKTFDAGGALIFARWNTRRAEADVSVPLTASGSVRARATFAWEDRDSYMDRYHERKKVGMVIMEADLTPATLLTVGHDLQHNAPTGATWGAVPYWNADGSLAKLPRNFSLSTTWGTWANAQDTSFASLEHRFGNGWRVHAGIAHTVSTNNTAVAYGGSGYPDPATGAGMSLWTGVWGEGKGTADNYEVYATGPFSVLGRTHTLIAGWNGTNGKDRSEGGDRTYPYPNAIPDYRAWTGDIPRPYFIPDGTHTDSLVRLNGTYLAGRFTLADGVTAIAGARLSNYHTETREYDSTGKYTGTSGFSEFTDEITPYYGVVWDLDERFSAYASYTSLFAPQSSRDRNNAFLPPAEGTNAEVGIKGEFLDGRLNASAAVFRTLKKNIARLDTSVPPGFLLPGGGQAYEANAEGIRARGIEFDASGQVTQAFNLAGGYTFLSAHEADGSRGVPDQPRHLFRLNGSYALDTLLPGLKAGGGITAQSRIYSISWYGRPSAPAGEGLPEIGQGGYALVNAMVSYQFTPKLSAQLNVSNLFDRHYYRNVGFYDGVYWGEPRKATLTLRGRF
jgi:outer membrane receptor for ferric coprogen and ferric-rhodotorulic acid